MTSLRILPGDLRLRIVAAACLVTTLALLDSLVAATAGLVLALAAAVPAAAGRGLWRRLLHVEAMVLLLLVILPLTTPGRPLVEAGPLTVSAEGTARALLIGAKVSAAALVLSLLLGGIDPVRLGGGLRALGVPDRLVRLLVTTARHLDLVGAEMGRMRQAMRVRGFRPRSDRHTRGSYGHLVGMMLVRALDRAERIDEAMRLRGPAMRLPRTPLPAPATADWAGFAALLAVAGALVALDGA